MFQVVLWVQNLRRYKGMPINQIPSVVYTIKSEVDRMVTNTSTEYHQAAVEQVGGGSATNRAISYNFLQELKIWQSS